MEVKHKCNKCGNTSNAEVDIDYVDDYVQLKSERRCGVYCNGIMERVI